MQRETDGRSTPTLPSPGVPGEGMHGPLGNCHARSSSNRYPWYFLLALPITRLELPGWGYLGRLGLFGIETDRHWKSAPDKTVRGKWHGYLMHLQLSDWSERQTYFLGRYHDLGTQLLMSRCLRPGDRVVDVGANIGMVSLHAAALVGDTGIVEAFEPQPACCQRITASVEMNRLRQIRLHRIGLSDVPDTLTLSVSVNHSGTGTLGTIREEDARWITSRVQVPVQTGDSVLLSDDRPIALVKIDVEGFETRVLRGMRETLARWKPIVTTEVFGPWLERAGSSVGELTQLMRDMGYRPFGLSTSRRLLRHRLTLTPLGDSIPAEFTEVAWVPHSGPFAQRLSG